MTNEIFDSEPVSRVFVGIDPGKKGCLAVITNTGELVEIYQTPIITMKNKRRYDVHAMDRLLKSLQSKYTIGLAAIEQQQAYPGQGAVSNYSTGRGEALWEMGLVANAIAHQRVHPQKWQRRFFPRVKGQSKPLAMQAAQSLFPNWVFKKSKDGEFDAALIAEWGRREMYGAA